MASESRFYAPTGAQGAGEAIQALLLQQEEQRRRDRIQAANEADKKAADARDQQRIGLEDKRLAQEVANQQELRRQAKDAEDYRRASNYVSGNAPPGVVDTTMADAMDRFGLGGDLKRNQVHQGAYLGEDENSIPQYEVQPGVIEFPGGYNYRAARTAADERAQAAREAQQARYDAALEQRTFQGQQNDLARENTRAIADNANATRQAITGATAAAAAATVQTKAEAKAAETAKKEADAADQVARNRKEIRDMAQNILDDPNLDSIAGWWDAHTKTFLPGSVQAEKNVAQLKAKLKVEARGALKGQGTISDMEGKMLGDAVDAIDLSAGQGNVRAQIQKIVDAMQGDAPVRIVPRPGVAPAASHPAGIKSVVEVP